jgi:N6-L-threonylcarbamoyladenine synthase
LRVKHGELGLRQSDALFQHTAQLPEVLEQLFAQEDGAVAVVGVSDKPRDVAGSYMPCFLPGVLAAQGIASALRVPLKKYSHQQGHLAAALFSAKRLDLLDRDFLALHVSGGTTELLRVRPGLEAEIIGGSEDLKAGQLVDRVGVMLGLQFPCGPALDALAGQGVLPRKISPAVRGLRCHFSGLENQCQALREAGAPSADIARFALCAVAANLEAMVLVAQREHGALPLVFSGGVCCSMVLRAQLLARFPHALFAEPEFSADNAAGVAVLCHSLRYTGIHIKEASHV